MGVLLIKYSKLFPKIYKLKKKILIFSTHFYPENFIINDLVKRLSKKYNFFVVTSFPHYPKKEYYKDYSIFDIFEKKNSSLTILRLPVLGRAGNSFIFLGMNYISYLISFIFFLPIFFFIRFHSIFVFQTSPVTVAIPAIILKFLLKKKITIWILDIWPEVVTSVCNITNKNLIYKILNLITKFIYKHSDTILVSSREFKKNINLKIINKEIIFFPQWSINLKRKKNKFIKEDNTFKIFHIGNMGEAQDFKSILKAIEICPNNISWHFVGDGSARLEFEESLKYLRIKKNIYFYGSLPQDLLYNYYSKADALLLSLKKSKILELYLPAKLSAYLYYSKPILLMASGDAYDLINDYKCGLVAKSGDYKKLSYNALKLSKSNKKFKLQLKQNSRKLYKKYFNFINNLKILKSRCFN